MIKRVNNCFNLTVVESCCTNPYEPQLYTSIKSNSLQLTRGLSYSHASPSQRMATQMPFSLANTESQRRVSDDNKFIKYTITRMAKRSFSWPPSIDKKTGILPV